MAWSYSTVHTSLLFSVIIVVIIVTYANNGDSHHLTERPHHSGNAIVLYYDHNMIHTYTPIKSVNATQQVLVLVQPPPVLNTLHHNNGT